MEALETLRQWVRESRRMVFFGGAGVSTESGIPDFRSVDGLYNQKFEYPPETIISHEFYLSNPAYFFRFYREKMLCLDAQPNPAHEKLAQLEQEGKLGLDDDIREYMAIILAQDIENPILLDKYLMGVELEVDAYIPASYIVNEQQKLDIYKRIAGVETESESAEMKEELLDRFGTVPKSVDNLLRIALLRAQAHKLYIMEIKGRPGELRFVYRPDARVHGENIPMLFEQYGNSLKFLPQGNPVFTYQFKRSNVVEKNSEDLLSQAEQMIKDMQRCLL